MERVNNLIPNVVNQIVTTKKSPNYFNYPYIDAEAHKITMDNYRKKRHEFNLFVAKENKEINKYNVLVEAYQQAATKRNNNPQQGTTILNSKPITFNGINEDRLLVREYNELVEQHNQKYGPIYKKKRYTTIKTSLELTFSTILSFYQSQLKRHNLQRMEAGIPTEGILPHIRVHSLDIAQYKKDGIPRLGLHKRTIQRHLKAFREAGIVNGYVYQGSHRPTKVYITNEIILIKDHTPKLFDAEKQPFTLPSATSCLYLSGNTSTPLRNPKKESLKTTTDKDSLSNEITVNENTTKVNANSRFLQNRVQEQYKLARELSQGKHVSYTPVAFEKLHQEATKGTLSRSEFKTLLIQEILKYSARLWTKKYAYIGSWMQAFELFQSSNLVTASGKLFHKDTMLKEYQKWLWMVDRANSWLNNKGKYTLFPHEYFDHFRTEKQEGGFWHWSGRYESQQRATKQKREQRKENGVQRKSNHRKFVGVINKYLAKKVTIQELQDYVATNLPHRFSLKLGDQIQKQIQQQILGSYGN